MQLLNYCLCFVGGAFFTLFSLFVRAWYLDTQARIKEAEALNKEMEKKFKLLEEQQEAANAMLQNSIAELAKRRAQVTQPAVAPQAPANPNISASVKTRLRKAVELTSKQAKIDVRMGPEFVMQHNELELEKLALLKTILADGYDPVITIRYNTGDQEMLLSTYVQSINKGLT